jgi:hypothetical protein
MKITFVGDPRGRIDPDFKTNDPGAVTLWGMEFKKDEPVYVPDDGEWAKRHGDAMRANTHFVVEEGGAPASAAKPEELSADPVVDPDEPANVGMPVEPEEGEPIPDEEAVTEDGEDL